jgi:hypothetical protein
MALVHELTDGIELEASTVVPWTGSLETTLPIVVRHELGDARPVGMRPVLSVPPWCTFHIDAVGEPASLFHSVFGEVDRLLSCEKPGERYVVRYAASPRAQVIALQSELTAYSFALAARGVGLIAHSCAFVLADGTGVLCPGMSGAGKTTLAQLVRDHVRDIEVLTDDRAIITLDDCLTVWGSPWPGAARIAGSGSAPLGVVMFLRHGTSVALRSVRASEAFRRIVNTLSMPLWEPARCGRALEIVDAVISRAVLVEATYPPTVDAALQIARELARLGR